MDHIYLNMLEHFLVPQVSVNSVIWQHDGFSPNYHGAMTWYLNQTLSGLLTEYVEVRLMSQNRGHHLPIVHPRGECVGAIVMMMLAGDKS
jgi:hypothetical protein